MRGLLFSVSFFAVASCCFAQEPSKRAPGHAKDPTAFETYDVRLSEYRLDDPVAPTLSATDIVTMLTSGEGAQKHQPVETIRLTAVSGSESLVQFGRSVSVTTGTMSTGRPGTVSKQMEWMQVGTILQVLASPAGEKIAVGIEYESSELDGEGTDESPPNEQTTQIHTKLMLESGKPALLGGMTADNSSFILITISRR